MPVPVQQLEEQHVKYRVAKAEPTYKGFAT